MATILVVDDLGANRERLVTILGRHGHRLIEAGDGAEALAAARREQPDLIITDVLMPAMDGFELVQQLRRDRSIGHTPVIFYTAYYGEREAKMLARSCGVSVVLTKPCESADVLQAVDGCLRGSGDGHSHPLAPPDELEREHLRLLTAKLSENAAELTRANARLRALVNIGLDLASERDSARLLTNVCSAAQELFGATYATLGIMDRGVAAVECYVASGAEGTWFTAGDVVGGVLRQVLSDRRAFRADNPGGDPARLGLPAGHARVETFLVAPVVSPSHVYGWMWLVNNEGRGFSDDDEQLAVALAGLVGRIYENSYFYRVAMERTIALEREIQERERAELELRRERDRAQRYLDTAGVILLALDVDMRITLVNRYACAVLGWTAEELLGRSWIDSCVPARMRDEMIAKLGKLFAGELPVNENPVLTRSGEERLIEWHNTVLRDEAGQVVGAFTSGTDVTARNDAIEASRTAEERMRFALENANVGIWDMDYTTGVLRWSDILERHYGFDPGTFPGTLDAFLARIHPDDRRPFSETLARCVRTGADFTTVHRAVQPTGNIRWMSGIGRIYRNDKGRAVRGLGISLDITERRILEDQYQHAQKMEAVGRLAGGVAHDFNNLLTAILGYCELLLGEMDPRDPRRPDVVEIQNAGSSAAALTRQLLAFSRKQIVQPTRLNLNSVIETMQGMLRRLIGEDIEVILKLRAGVSDIMADRGQMEQVVLNLAINAKDAMPSGGTLTIETANVELDEEYAKAHVNVTPGPYVMLAVSDTGTGMTPAVKAHLFEPFFTTKEVGKGTGLGLATVYGIATRDGGSVEAYSEIGHGTTFKVYLREAAATDGRESPRSALPGLSGSETVLVVEDNPGLRELARRLLARHGYTVLLAGNADEATRLCEREGRIDVLLTDVVMPGASGPELTKRLVAARPTMKVIYMSGYTEDAIVHHGVLAPGIAFLQKPFTTETLGRKLRDVLDG